MTATGVDRLDAATFARDRQRPIMASPIACEPADSGEDVVVSEHTAAFLARNRAAEVIEVVELSEDSSETS